MEVLHDAAGRARRTLDFRGRPESEARMQRRREAFRGVTDEQLVERLNTKLEAYKKGEAPRIDAAALMLEVEDRYHRRRIEREGPGRNGPNVQPPVRGAGAPVGGATPKTPADRTGPQR